MKVLSFLSPTKSSGAKSSSSSPPTLTTSSGKRKVKRSLFGRAESKAETASSSSSSTACGSCSAGPSIPSILKVKSQKASLKSTTFAAVQDDDDDKPRSPPIVGFDKVDVLYHDTVLCRNPGVSEGPPIALGWKNVESEYGLDLDEYEAASNSNKQQQPERKKKKTRNQLKLDCEQREQILLAQGVTRQQINNAMEEVHYIKWHREVSRRAAPPKDRRRYKMI